ncbi:MAG: hypothetical protein JSS81_10790 [Acidobacteria bacterium]|nr:hypothetical protein [Acidobacteriota bacterium]
MRFNTRRSRSQAQRSRFNTGGSRFNARRFDFNTQRFDFNTNWSAGIPARPAVARSVDGRRAARVEIRFATKAIGTTRRSLNGFFSIANAARRRRCARRAGGQDARAPVWRSVDGRRAARVEIRLTARAIRPMRRSVNGFFSIANAARRRRCARRAGGQDARAPVRGRARARSNQKKLQIIQLSDVL